MKRSLRFRSVLLAAAFAGSAFGQTTLYWDTNGATAGSSAGTTAAGGWSNLGPNWSTTADGTGPTQNWIDGSNAVFSAGTNATGTYVVSFGGELTVANLSFQLGNVTVDQNLLNITQGVHVASGSSGTITSEVRPSSSFTKTGDGTLTFGGILDVSDVATRTFNLAGGQIALTGPGAQLNITFVAVDAAAGTTFAVSNGARLSPVRLELSGSGTLEIGSAGIFEIGSGGVSLGSGTPTLALSGGTVSTFEAATVSPRVTLSPGTTSTFLSADASRNLVLAGGVAGSGAFNKIGPATLTLNGDNTAFSGGATLTSGTLALGHSNALGSGALTFAGGHLLVQGVSPTLTPFVIQDGSATVTGNGTVLSSSTYVEVGSGGPGVLNISNGGKVNAATSAVAGIGTSGNGTITVAGSGSQLNVGTLFVTGYSSATSGSLALTDSGSATIGQSALIGYEGTGTLSVASGASFTTGHDINIGFGATGSGTLSVSGGGTVTTGLNAYIGYAGNSTATVSGAGSTWNVGAALYTGFGATGTLTIGDGAAVAADYVDLARNPGSTGTITVNSGGTLSLGGLTQGAGSATVHLAGGTLGIINRSFATPVPLALADNTTSTVAISGLAVQFNGVISGSGALAKAGVGVVALNAANTYSGGTTVNAGTLALGHASALGSTSAPLTLNGGVLDLGGFSPTTGTVVFNGGTFANGTLANASAFEVRTGSLSAALTGAATLTKTGPGTFTLSGANTYTGATTIDAGTLVLGTATTLGSTAGVTVNSGATLGLNNFTVTLGALGGTGTVDLGAGDLQFGNASNQTLAASLTGSGTLTKVGTGTLTLTGTNVHTGGTRVHAGTVLIDSLASFGTGPGTLDGGGLRWATGTSADISSVSLVLGTSGATLDTNGRNVSLDSAITGAGGFTKIGEGVLTVRGANTYDGIATIDAGTLRLGAANTVNGTGGIVLGAAGTFDLNDFNASVPTLTGSGTVALGTGTLTLGNSSPQTLSAPISGSGALVKVGSGHLTLTGASTFSGGIRVNAGLLEFGSLANLGSGLVTLNGGTLRWADATTTDVSPRLAALGTGGGRFDTNGSNVTFSTALSGSGALTKSGAGTLTLSTGSSYTGGTHVQGGAVEFSQLSAFGTGMISLNGGALRWATGSTVDVSARLAPFGPGGGGFDTNGNDVTFAAALPGTGTVTKTGAGTLTLTGASTGGTARVTAGTLALSGPGASLTTEHFISVSDGGLRVAAGGQVTSAGFSSIGDSVEGTASLVVDGIGSRFASTDALVIGHTGAANATVSDGGQLHSSTSITVGYGDQSSGHLTISGGGVVSSPGSITLGDQYINSFPAANLSSGTVLVTGVGSRLETAANLIVGNLGTGNLTIANGAVVTVGGYAQLGGADYYGPAIAAIGDGTLNLQSGGTLEIGGTDAFRRNTRTYYDILTSPHPITLSSDHFNLSGGTLKVTSPLTSTVRAFLTNVSTIDTNGSSAVLSGGLSGPGGLAKTGAGTLTLGGANTYSGATTVSAGTLALGAGGTLASPSIHLATGATFDTTAAGSFTFASGRTLSGSGTVVGNLAIAPGGVFSPGASAGLFTVNGNLSLAGLTRMELGGLVRGTGYDATDINGSIDFGGTLAVSFLVGFSPATGMNFDLFDWTGTSTGAFGSVNLPSLGAGLAWNTSTLYADGKLAITGSAIPEPSTYAAIIGACALVLAAARRHSRSTAVRPA